MSKTLQRRPKWWRVWLATAAVIPLVAGGAAIASYASTDVDATPPELSAVAPADLAEAVPLEPTAELPVAIAEAPIVPSAPAPTNPGEPTDPVAPVIKATYPSSQVGNYGGWYTDGVTVTLKATATAPASIDLIEWTLSGATTGSGSDAGTTALVPITADGETTITFSASDSEGLSSASQTLTFKVDSLAPTPVIHNPKASTVYTAGDEIVADYFCGDLHTWLCFFTFSNGVTAASGQTVVLTADMTSVTLTVMDFARHESSTTVALTVVPGPDVTAPMLTATSNVAPGATGWITNPSTRVDVVATDTSDVELIEYRKPVEGGGWTPWSVLSHSATGLMLFYNQNGVFTYQFRATDVAGNVSDPIEYDHRVDAEISAATVSGFPGNFEVGDSYELFYSCSDAVSGVAECSSSNGASGQPLPTDTKGEFTFTLTNRDNAGNEKTTTWSYTVGVDTTAPLVAITTDPTPNAAGWTSADSVDVMFAAHDASGIDRLWVEGSGADPLPGQFIDSDSFRFTTDVEGTTVFTAYAIDSEGNQSVPVLFEHKLDRTAPTITVTSPENVRTLLAALQQVEQGSEVELVFECDDVLSGVVSCDGPASLPTDALGDQSVDIIAVDAAGNRVTETLEYTVVAAAPTEQPGSAGAPRDPSTLARTGSSYPIWPAIAFVATVLAIGAGMLASARRAAKPFGIGKEQEG